MSFVEARTFMDCKTKGIRRSSAVLWFVGLLAANLIPRSSAHSRRHFADSAARFRYSVGHQEKGVRTAVNEWRTGVSKATNARSNASVPDIIRKSSTALYYVKIALAGGIAGAVGTTGLYPLDCAKTLRQSQPGEYKSVSSALYGLLSTPGGGRLKERVWHVHRAYRGVIPAAMGALPSSALYFGAYESCKVFLQRSTRVNSDKASSRLLLHAGAAASGNLLSSSIFVPKELIKSQMQVTGRGMVATIQHVFQTKGVIGFFSGFQATLMRNIPSAAVRFVLYEEIKRTWSDDTPAIKYFVSGAVAGALASGFMTPIDVVKTRLATGTCPAGVPSCLMHVVKTAGWRGLYAGGGTRMMMSGAFSAIGFGTFELAKNMLGVSELEKFEAAQRGSPVKSVRRSRLERRLEHAISDHKANK